MKQVDVGSILKGENGQYRVVKFIGRGGIGVVWRCQSLSTGNDVAAKVLHADRFATTDSVLKRFEAEFKLGLKLRHRNLARVIDRSPNDEEPPPFLVMDFIAGERLSDVITRLSIHERQSVSIDLINGISEIHRSGIVHRDIKSNNVIIRPDNVAVICDYGLLKEESPSQYLTVPEDKFGSLLYISENQAHNPANATAADDIYSLCAVLFEIFSACRMSIRWTTEPLLYAYPKLQHQIVAVLSGSINRDSWPTLSQLNTLIENIPVDHIQRALDARTRHNPLIARASKLLLVAISAIIAKPVSTITDEDLLILPDLDLSRTAAGDGDLEFVAIFSSLRRLVLDQTMATNSGLAHISKLVELRELMLATHGITSAGIEHICHLPKLRRLRLGAGVTDTALHHLVKLPSLKALRLNGSGITDAGIEELARCPALDELHLDATSTTIEGRDRLRKLKPSISVFPEP